MRLPRRSHRGRGAARTEADAGLAALALLQQIRPVATVRGDNGGNAAAPDPEAAMQHAFIVLFVWSGARADEKIVYGPRFVVYTPIVQLADGSPALDAANAVRENASVIDRLCRLSLVKYDEWRTTAALEPLTVLVGGAVCSVDAGGGFDDTGERLVVQQGRYSTHVDASTRLPFRDTRLQHV